MIQKFHFWVYIYERNKILIQKDTCTSVFIAVLFIIAKIRKQPECPSIDERIKKMWHIYIYI